ncbi:hypothetical protein JCM10212_005912 [Sporobolomyces blumeae]
MSRPGAGFFDDDDDETPDSYEYSYNAAGPRPGAGAEDSLSSSGLPSPRRNRYAAYNGAGPGPAAAGGRQSSVATAGQTSARHTSVMAAAAGSSVRGAYASTRGGSPSLDDILGRGGDLSRERNVQRLLRAWQNEAGAPELLEFPKKLVETMVRDLARRKAIVRRAQMTSGHDDGFYTTAAIVATENMRAAHVLKMYTRERIFKLEQCAEYYLSLPDVHERLYHNEIEHAQGYVRLVKAYHDAAAMDAMPADAIRHPPPMPTPDFSKPVFFRALRDCPQVVLPDGEPFAFQEGTQHMCRYSTIRALLAAGDVELI